MFVKIILSNGDSTSQNGPEVEHETLMLLILISIMIIITISGFYVLVLFRSDFSYSSRATDYIGQLSGQLFGAHIQVYVHCAARWDLGCPSQNFRVILFHGMVNVKLVNWKSKLICHNSNSRRPSVLCCCGKNPGPIFRPKWRHQRHFRHLNIS